MTTDDRLAAKLLHCLRVYRMFADEAARAWDSKQNMRTGSLLLALAGRNHGYHPQIDAIHETIKEAAKREAEEWKAKA